MPKSILEEEMHLGRTYRGRNYWRQTAPVSKMLFRSNKKGLCLVGMNKYKAIGYCPFGFELPSCNCKECIPEKCEKLAEWKQNAIKKQPKSFYTSNYMKYLIKDEQENLRS